jgi:capsular polysaccharide biosynthesis protein
MVNIIIGFFIGILIEVLLFKWCDMWIKKRKLEDVEDS